jgi:hypothetical protein
MVSDKFDSSHLKLMIVICKYDLFPFWLTLSFYIFLISGGQKLDQHRRSKRLQAKPTLIQYLGGGDSDNNSDIFGDSYSNSEDG